jgi:hypothetical protein
VIPASSALVTREQQIFVRSTDSLAQLIAEDMGEASGAVEPWVAANARRHTVARLTAMPLRRGTSSDTLVILSRSFPAERRLGVP